MPIDRQIDTQTSELKDKQRGREGNRNSEEN